jgi:hypothetical protein
MQTIVIEAKFLSLLPGMAASARGLPSESNYTQPSFIIPNTDRLLAQ